MRKALKTIDIDAFQNALKIFCRIKSGRVATDELAAVLDSMDIPVIPETFQEVIKHASIDSNHRVDIRDIIFTLDELQHQYEDFSFAVLFRDMGHPVANLVVYLRVQFSEFMVYCLGSNPSIMEWSGLDESPSNRKLSNISECYLQYRKKSTLSSRLFEPSLFPKLNRKNLQHHKIMEDNDYLEFKRPKNPSQIKKFLNGVDSSNIGFQEPYSKDGINFKKYSEKIEIHDSKSIPHNLKSITSLKKSLDKSDTFSIPKLQKPTVRRHSSPLKQVSLKEKATTNALGQYHIQNIREAISKLQENYIAAEELKSILPSIGITLSDKVFKKIVTDTTQNESGMVNLDDFMNALTIDQSLPEYDVLTDIIKAIDKIKDENMDYEDLNTCIQGFGVYLSKPEFEKITELTEANVLPETIENLHNLSKEKMNASYLWNTLSRKNNNLKKKEFLDALKLAIIDEDDEVQIEEFGKVVKDMRDASRLKELQDIVLALDVLEGDMIPGKNLESFLRNIGIKSPEEEIEKILQSDFVSDDNMVNVKDCMKALKDNQKFSNFLALNDIINSLDSMEESDQSDKDKYADVLGNTNRIYFTDDSLQEILDDSFVEEIKEAAHILSSVDNGKIGIPNLERALESLNVNLTEEDISEALKCCDISGTNSQYQVFNVSMLDFDFTDNKEVNLKDFFERIKESPHFKESIATQLLLATTQILQNDLIDASELKALLINNDFYAANVLLNEVLRHEPEPVLGKVGATEGFYSEE
ncbi:EF-hand calcium-binding domain-containing protein 13 [Halichoerus grypus]